MITQAIIPAAGLGTRFLPVTKVVPKELLPIMAKPALQFVVEELVESGIQEIILVLSPEKESVFEYFSQGGFVDQMLKERGKQDKLKHLQRLLQKVSFKRVYQDQPLGLGHAIACAKENIDADYFVVALPDDLVFSKTACTKQMFDAFKKSPSMMLAVEAVEASKVSSYGIVSPKNNPDLSQPFDIDHVVEKPQPKDAPSNQAIIGRYILPKEIFNQIQQEPNSPLQEIQITDAIERVIQTSKAKAFPFEGKRIDVGQPIGFVQANMIYANDDPSYRETLQQFMKEIF